MVIILLFVSRWQYLPVICSIKSQPPLRGPCQMEYLHIYLSSIYLEIENAFFSFLTFMHVILCLAVVVFIIHCLCICLFFKWLEFFYCILCLYVWTHHDKFQTTAICWHGNKVLNVITQCLQFFWFSFLFKYTECLCEVFSIVFF